MERVPGDVFAVIISLWWKEYPRGKTWKLVKKGEVCMFVSTLEDNMRLYLNSAGLVYSVDKYNEQALVFVEQTHRKFAKQ
jgi:hypothetical protein